MKIIFQFFKKLPVDIIGQNKVNNIIIPKTDFKFEKNIAQMKTLKQVCVS